MRLFPLSSSTKKALFRALKHPLLIAAIASWLIPLIVERSNARAAREQARIDQAVEMINTSNSVNSLLNKMKTEFESFENDSLGASSPEVYGKRREQLRDRIHSLHSEFDGIAWWWPWKISYRVGALKLLPADDFRQLDCWINEYLQNVKATSALFAAPRDAYLLADAPMPKSKVMPNLGAQFHKLQTDRDKIVHDMAALEIGNHPETQCVEPASTPPRSPTVTPAPNPGTTP